MSVTIWDGDFYEGNQGYFSDGETPNLSNYTQSDGESWNNDISSLYTSTYLKVFDYRGYDSYGGYTVLAPGYWSGPELADFGLNNDISSFYYMTAVPA